MTDGNNPFDRQNAVNTNVDRLGNTNIFVGDGNGHSHTVISPNGDLLFDRDSGGNIFTGNPPGALNGPVYDLFPLKK